MIKEKRIGTGAMKNEKTTNNNLPITIKAAKPVWLYMLMGFVILFALLGFVFSKLTITRYADFDDDRYTVYEQVYVEITELPLAYETSKSKCYCIGHNEGNDYIFMISQKQYDKIKETYEQDGDDFRYRIEGKTNRIYPHMKEASTKFYNSQAGEIVITDSNYMDHFGDAYIDGTEASAGTIISTLCYGLCVMWLIIAALLSIFYICDVVGMKKKLAKYDKEELERQLNAPEAAIYAKAGVGLTEKNIISYAAGGINVLPYDEIYWVYILKRKTNFITTSMHVMAGTKRRGLIQIAIAYDEKMLKEIIAGICRKNPSVLAGYTKENKKKYRDYLINQR